MLSISQTQDSKVQQSLQLRDLHKTTRNLTATVTGSKAHFAHVWYFG